MLIMIIPFMIAFAFLNRARGTRLYNATGSTEFGRIVSMMGMAVLTSFLFLGNFVIYMATLCGSFSFFLLWASMGWDKYWSEEIGHSPTHSKIYGLMQMTIRMTLAAPAIIFIALLSGNPDHVYYGAGSLLLGLPYIIGGAIYPKNPIGLAEYSVGALLGASVFLAAYGG